MSEIRIDYAAPPTLTRFLASDAFARAVIGPFGSGKSTVCVLELLRRSVAQRPGRSGIRKTRWAVIRNTYRQLRDTTRKTFEEWTPAELGFWREQAFTWEYHFEDVRAEVLFRALDRPGDVANLYSLDLTGAWINEARESPSAIFSTAKARVGRYPSKMDGGPTWRGIWCDSNPWPKSHWGYKLFSAQSLDDHELFEQPSGLSQHAENVENLPVGYYETISQGQDSEWVDTFVRGQYPDFADGAIFGKWISALEQAGRVSEFDHSKSGVYTFWDLGIGDSTAIWFVVIGPDRHPQVIDYYENHGCSISHYNEVLRGKGYEYAKHWLPHDARPRTFITGTSIQQTMIDEWGASCVEIVPRLGVADGIDAARALLERPIVFHQKRCEEGLESLGSYKYAYDEVTKSFSPNPEHDWSSHGADAFRYFAVIFRAIEAKTRPPVEIDRHAGSVLRGKQVIAPKPIVKRPTLDELFEMRLRNHRR